MFDRTDLDLRISAHQNHIDVINNAEWHSAATSSVGSLRGQIATALVTLASKLDGAHLVPAASQKPAGSMAA
jgi:hypothetical protein